MGTRLNIHNLQEAKKSKEKKVHELLVVPEGYSPLTGSTRNHNARPFWVIDEKVYDFSDWLFKHPGGTPWFCISNHRDISILYHAYHKDARKLHDKLKTFLVKEEDWGDDMGPERVNPTLGVPPFLLIPNFNARRDIPLFDFNNPDKSLPRIRELVTSKSHQAKVDRMDRLWDMVTVGLFLVYLYFQVALAYSLLPAPLLVFGLLVLRTSLSGAGHYGVHRSKPEWSEGLFDVSYVGTSLIGEDGHVLLHHPYTQSGGDVKRTFFASMMALPWWFRVPGYTLHKFGVFITGLCMRGAEVQFLEGVQNFRWHFWVVRAMLYAEFFLCIYMNRLGVWMAQYLISLWFNTFLVVSSHDFELQSPQSIKDLDPKHRDDWGMLQLHNCFDFTIVGIRYIDVFLSAGLSPHRAHHLLPYQRSGFANLCSEEICRTVAEDMGYVWSPPRNWWTDRLPAIVSHYLFSPARDPMSGVEKKHSAYSLSALSDALKYTIGGFIGIGAV